MIKKVYSIYKQSEIYDIFGDIEKSKCLDPDKLSDLKIIITEVIENTYYHSKPTKDIKILIKKNKDDLYILIFFHTGEFDLRIDNIARRKVYFDHLQNRYRGIGMNMCYNLSKYISLKVLKSGWVILYFHL